MNVIGVDPGLSGAVALLGPGLLEVRRDFKHWEDIPVAIAELQARADVAVIELVNAMPGEGVTSMFSFGRSAGIALGALAAHGFVLYKEGGRPLLEVSPLRWQNYFWDWFDIPKEERGDFDSRQTLRRFLPSAAEYLQREKDHNSGDAICMALWYQCNQGAATSARERDAKTVARLKRKRLTLEKVIPSTGRV